METIRGDYITRPVQHYPHISGQDYHDFENNYVKTGVRVMPTHTYYGPEYRHQEIDTDYYNNRRFNQYNRQRLYDNPEVEYVDYPFNVNHPLKVVHPLYGKQHFEGHPLRRQELERQQNYYLGYGNRFGPKEYEMYGMKGFGRFGPEIYDYPEVYGYKGWNGMPVSRRQQWYNWRHNTTDAYPTDSDIDYIDNLLEKKLFEKHIRQYNQRRQHVTEPNWEPVECTLCWQPIRPLVDTEVLDCGHIYHRFCLKKLFAIADKNDQKNVFCSHCKQVVEPTLINKLKTRLTLESTDDKTNDKKVLKDLKNYEI